MNKSFLSIWSEALGSWVAVAETTRARGKRSGGVVAATGNDVRFPVRQRRCIVTTLGFAITAMSAGTAYAATCGGAYTVSQTCTVASFSPAANNNMAGTTTVTGGATVQMNGTWTGTTGSSGYTLVPLSTVSIISGNPNQTDLSIGGETQGVTTPNPVTGSNTVVAAYNSNNFSASNWGTTNVAVYQNVNGNQYTDAGASTPGGLVGTVTGGTLAVDIGNSGSSLSATGNAIAMAGKSLDLVYADGTGTTPSVVNWNSDNQINFNNSVAPASGTSATATIQVPTYGGTFTAFNGSSWTVTDAASLAAYNNFLIQSLQSGALNSQAAYNAAFNQAVSFTTETVQYNGTSNTTAGDLIFAPAGTISAMHGSGANATLNVQSGGEIDIRNGYAVLAQNGAGFNNNGQISGDFTLVSLQSGAQGVNNGVISSGYNSGTDFNTGTSAQPSNFGFNAYTEGGGVAASGTGTSFVNNGIMNVAAWNLTNTDTAQQNYAVQVSGNAVASNAGIINVGVNADNAATQAIGGLVGSGGIFTNTAGGTIYIGRAAQYDVASPESVPDMALGVTSYGILLSNSGSSGTANNAGNIIIGSQTQNATGMASISSAAGSILNNSGAITINGAASGVPLANIGMLASNTAATVTNTGTITLNGINGIGIEVFGTGSTPTAVTSTGTINVAGGADPGTGTRNYGVWAQGSKATATINGGLNLTGTGTIGVFASAGATVNVGASALPGFSTGTNQIGFFTYGAGSTINVAAQNLTVGTAGSTLFRVAGGAAYTGSSSAGTMTLNIDGQGAQGVVATDAGTTLSTGNSVYNVNGANGIAIMDEGGAAGTINAATTINLNAAAAIAGVVDGQAYDLTNTATGTPTATTLTNNAAVTSATAGVTGFVAQNLGTLANNSAITLTGAGSTGVVVGPQGTVNNTSTIKVSDGTGALVQGATATLTNTGTIEADSGTAAIHLTRAGASVTLSGGGAEIAGGTADGVLIDATDSGGGVSAGATSITVNGSGQGISNLGANSTITLAGTRIDTSADSSDGVSSTGTGATISADPATTISTAGNNAIGLFVSGAGSTVTNSSATVTTFGQNAVGIQMSSGASGTLSGGQVATTGLSAHGIEATGSGSSITSTGGTVVNTTGVSAIGAYATSGGSLTLTGSQISTTGANATGVQADIGTGTQGGAATLSGGSVTTGAASANGLMVTGTTSTINAGNALTVSTSGTSANGVMASSGGAATLASVVVKTKGDGSDGVQATGAGSSITSTSGTGVNTAGASAIGAYATSGGSLTLTDAQISTTGANATGVQADIGTGTQGGTATLSGGSVTTGAASADGLLASGATSTINAGNALTVSTSGTSANGVMASSGGTATLASVVVKTTGDGSDGVQATGSGSSITSTSGTVVNTSGASAIGAYATSGGSLALTGSQISTTGANATGVQADIGTGTQGGAATLSGGSVTTGAASADGLLASGTTSTIKAGNALAVTTSGTSANGVMASDGGAATLASVVVRTTGAEADGLVAQNGGSVTDTSSSISSAAANGATADSGGILTLNVTTLKGTTSGIVTSDTLANGATNTVTVTGGSVTSTTGPAFLANGGTADITVQNGTTVTAGNGTLLNLTNGSNVTFTASGENLTGNIFSDAASAGDIFLTNHTTLTGYIDPVAMTIDNTSTWNVTASSTLSSLNNAGNVAFVAPTGDPSLAGSYKTMTTGSYVGNGGTIALNTYLGTDTSPTDQLLVSGGSASGTTALKITNTTGSGAQTTSDGIPVVVAANGASTTTSAFHLAGPVQAGAYEYLLYRGGQSNADGWYLRSDLTSGATKPPSGSAGATPTPAQPAATAPVAYRPGVVGYTMTPSLNADYGFSTLGTLHERVGDIANVEKKQTGNHDGVWGRIGGQSLDTNADSRFATDEKTFFAQFGKDWTLDRAASGGSTHAGATVTIGTADASFSDAARSINPTLSTSTGSVEMHAQSLGGYWTRYLPDGTYFDSVGQLTHYNNQYSDVYGSAASQNGFGFALSQEVGKPFYLGSSAVAIEPQAQLMYQYLKLNGFEDNISAVSGTAINALRGRLGVRVFSANMDNDTHTSAATPYFTADVLHDFFAPGQTSVGGASFDSGLGRTWYQLGVGVTTNFGKSGEFYADVKYTRNLGGQYRQGVAAHAGYRYSW